jgi:hypothetical protein
LTAGFRTNRDAKTGLPRFSVPLLLTPQIRNYLLEVAMAGENDAAAFLVRLDRLITKYSN